MFSYKQWDCGSVPHTLCWASVWHHAYCLMLFGLPLPDHSGKMSVRRFTHTRTHTRARTHAHAHTRTRTHTHSTAQQDISTNTKQSVTKVFMFPRWVTTFEFGYNDCGLETKHISDRLVFIINALAFLYEWTVHSKCCCVSSRGWTEEAQTNKSSSNIHNHLHLKKDCLCAFRPVVDDIVAEIHKLMVCIINNAEKWCQQRQEITPHFIFKAQLTTTWMSTHLTTNKVLLLSLSFKLRHKTIWMDNSHVTERFSFDSSG